MSCRINCKRKQPIAYNLKHLIYDEWNFIKDVFPEIKLKYELQENKWSGSFEITITTLTYQGRSEVSKVKMNFKFMFQE